MTLGDYLRRHALTQRQFGALIAAGQGDIARWVGGSRIPRPETMRRIAQATGGAVTADDFYGIDPACGTTAATAPPDEGCRWIEGDPRHVLFGVDVWCGAATARPGEPYCAAHRARAWVRSATPARRDR